MVDTARTQTDLLTNLFQDGQPNNSITENDLRDLIKSVTPSEGGYFRNVSAITTIGTAGVYVKVAGTSTASLNLVDFTMPLSNRLVYTGGPNKRVTVFASSSFTVAANNKLVGFKIAKNGVVIDGTVVKRLVGTGSDVGAVSIIAGVTLSTNDYIELWVTNETDLTNVTVDEFHIHALGFIFI